MACPVPTAISNGYYVGAKVSYAAGDVIQYVCNTGYVISGSPVTVCDVSGKWIPASGSLPECNNSYLSNIWFLLVISLMGFVALVVVLILTVICCKVCCKTRVEDEESETENGGCYRPRCAC
eukprot:XP_019918206.1 PREDICTED: sushi domain-containing protein 2-like [Crassostrea gigas]